MTCYFVIICITYWFMSIISFSRSLISLAVLCHIFYFHEAKIKHHYVATATPLKIFPSCTWRQHNRENTAAQKLAQAVCGQRECEGFGSRNFSTQLVRASDRGCTPVTKFAHFAEFKVRTSELPAFLSPGGVGVLSDRSQWSTGGRRRWLTAAGLQARRNPLLISPLTPSVSARLRSWNAVNRVTCSVSANPNVSSVKRSFKCFTATKAANDGVKSCGRSDTHARANLPWFPCV